MSRTLGGFSRLVTVRPWITLLVLFIITFGLAAGAAFRAPPPTTAETLPDDSPVADAMAEINELFGDHGEISAVTLVFRGDALTPAGLSQMDALITDSASDPAVQQLLAPADPIIAPSSLIKFVLGVDSFESVTQAQIDAVRVLPEIQPALAAMTGTDTDGTRVAIGNIRLLKTGDERLANAERKINELAHASEGPLRGSSVSFIVIEDEYKEATETGMGPLIGLAFLLIALLLWLFMRTLSDMWLTLGGLLTSIIWIIGAEGWLGPNALGLIGPPNSLTTMVPIIVIGLTVDYAIQTISHYREQRAEGEDVRGAIRIGLRIVAVPLLLAAITTIVGMLASLFSPIEIVRDFGVVAGLGIGMSLIVMLTLVPAARTIIDRRREARGKLKPPRPIVHALPGIERVAGLLGRSVTRWPAYYMLAVTAITIGLGIAATGLKSEFKIQDVLPRGGAVLADWDTLDAAVGGSAEITNVLIRAEATETRTLLNVQDLTTAFLDETRRPSTAAGPIQTSYELLLRDWTTDSGEPGDKYDAEIAALFREASAGVQLDPELMQQILDRLDAMDPALGRVLINDPRGVDTLLLQFQSYGGDPGQTKVLQQQLEELWAGDDDAITATSESIISITVTDSITERQTEAIATTIAAALTVLALFFWVTLRQPALAVVAVGPIVFVLICVLGTMALVGIPYSLITSIITALSIGIGVDYTIHVIHRYREEFVRLRNPEEAAVRTLATTGSALLGSAMTTALGLGALAFSPLAASQQFGITAAITIAYSLIVSIVLVPPAMTIWGSYQNMRLRSMVEREWADLDVAIDEVYRRHEEATS
ncbi:MAG: MMPL family transporter [Chloroflexi bacterium]|nr:MMPL family transporter [Chloroflexota bacterium]MCY3937156.1 MMPL family transporter [Chloroflexota bacterium]